jgi:spore maturation protein SpmA
MRIVARVLGFIVFAPIVILLVLLPFLLIGMGVGMLTGAYDARVPLPRDAVNAFVGVVLLWLGLLVLWLGASLLEDMR